MQIPTNNNYFHLEDLSAMNPIPFKYSIKQVPVSMSIHNAYPNNAYPNQMHVIALHRVIFQEMHPNRS